MPAPAVLLHVRMKWLKWVLAVAAVIVLGIWLLMGLSFYRPIGRIVHIQTEGGGVPLYIVLFPDERWVRIEVGNDRNSGREKEWLSYEGRVNIETLKFNPLRYRLTFPGTSSAIEIEARDDGTRSHTGRWTQTLEDESIISLPAQSISMITKNWFVDGPPSNAEMDSHDFGGLWNLTLTSPSRRKIQLEILDSPTRDDPTLGWAHAQLAMLDISNQWFSGRFEGDRIWLASFDDAVPCLITASVQPDGTLVGELTRSDGPVRPFTATVAEP